MERILIVFCLLMLTAFAVTEIQLQNARAELRFLSNDNNLLEVAVPKLGQRIGRDAEKISALEAKINAPTAGQTAK